MPIDQLKMKNVNFMLPDSATIQHNQHIGVFLAGLMQKTPQR